MIDVKFFASLRDALGCAQDSYESSAATTLQELLELLQQRHGAAAEALTAEGVRIALNQSLLPVADHLATQLSAGDEVAFLPPVTGG